MNRFQIAFFGLIFFTAGVGFGAWLKPAFQTAEAPTAPALQAPALQAPAPQVSLGEVTELVDRLKAVAYKPNGDWYENGINLTFTGFDVALKIKTKNGNEYNARARQLKDVVSMIADPAGDLRAALQGWNTSAK